MTRPAEDYGRYRMHNGRIACRLCRLSKEGSLTPYNKHCPFCVRIAELLGLRANEREVLYANVRANLRLVV